MSNALRNVAESTAHVISDLVDEARDRIDDLPSMTLGRRKTSNRRWAIILVVAVVGVLAMVACRRRCRDTGNDSGPGAHLAEKSLAVS
jgi:hypothetical protein